MRISVDEVIKRFDGESALEGISFEVPAGTLLAVLGANGAGKTTLLRALATIYLPDSGWIELDGRRLSREDLQLRRRLAYLPDERTGTPGATVLEHVALVLRLYEAERLGIEEQVLELLDAFDLLPHAERALGQLSRGQAYKAQLIALLAAEPDLLLLDEPFASGVDPSGLFAMKERVRAVTARGGTVVYTTQVLEAAERFADRVLVLHEGRVAASGPLDELETAAGASALEHLFRKLRDPT